MPTARIEHSDVSIAINPSAGRVTWTWYRRVPWNGESTVGTDTGKMYTARGKRLEPEPVRQGVGDRADCYEPLVT